MSTTHLTDDELTALEQEFPDVGRRQHLIHRLIQALREARKLLSEELARQLAGKAP